MSAAIAVQSTSVDAYHAQGHAGRNKRFQQILAVLRDAWVHERIANLTATELTDRLQRSHPEVGWHPGNVSARLNEMVTAKLVQRCETPRLCSVSKSGRLCKPVMLVAKQGRLVA